MSSLQSTCTHPHVLRTVVGTMINKINNIKYYNTTMANIFITGLYFNNNKNKTSC